MIDRASRFSLASKVLAGTSCSVVAALFVFTTNRSIHKPEFYETAAWGLLLLAAFAGFGAALNTLLFPTRRADVGLRMIWGASSLVFASGVLAATSLFSRNAVLVLVDIGLVSWMYHSVRERKERAQVVRFVARVARRNVLLSTILGAVLLAAAVQYLGGVADATSNPYDDDVAYLPFVRRLLDTGTLIEPFSFRRLSALGGQTAMLAFVSPHATFRQLNTFDRGICVVIFVALLLGHRLGKRRLPAWLAILTVGFFLALPNTSINTAAHFAGFAFFLGLFRTISWLNVDDRVFAKGIVVALVAGATCTLRQNYLSVPPTMLAVCYGYRFFDDKSVPWKRRLVEPAVVALGSVVVLLPWLILAYRSNHTFLFPIQAGTFRHALDLKSPTLTPLKELRFFFSVGIENEPMKTLSLLALAGAFVKDSHPYKPLRALWIASAVALAFLSHAFTLSDAGNLGRYLFGFFAALAAATLLTIGTARFFGRGLSSTTRARVALLVAFGAIAVQLPYSREKVSKTYQTLVRNIDEQQRKPPPSMATAPVDMFLYSHVQSQVPAGESILLMVDDAYWLDHARNQIFNIDMPGYSSLKPDMPYFEGPEAVAAYLLRHGIRYVMYTRPEFSHYLYQRAFWFDRMFNEEEIWRLVAPYFVDFIDTLSSLRSSRKTVIEERGIVVLDLAASIK